MFGQEPFVSLRFKKRLSYAGMYNEKGLPYVIPANWISLFPVIKMFDGINGCYTSNKLLSNLAGIRNDIVPKIIKDGIDLKWIKEITPQNSRRRNTSYKLDDYDYNNSEEWLVIGKNVISNYIWASMEQSRQLVYTVLLSQSMHPSFSLGVFERDGKVSNEVFELNIDIDEKNFNVIDCDFVPYQNFDPEKMLGVINNRCLYDFPLDKKMSKRTFNNAIDWLMKNNIIYDYENVTHESIVIPRNPCLDSLTPEVKERIERMKERAIKIKADNEAHNLSYWAKRKQSAMRERRKMKEMEMALLEGFKHGSINGQQTTPVI